MDQQLTVKINLVAGSNQATQALVQQAKAADELAKRLGYAAELQKRIGQFAAQQPGAGSAGAARLQQLREQLEKTMPRIAVSMPNVTGGPPGSGAGGTEGLLRNLMVRHAAGSAPGFTRQALNLNAPAYGNELAGVGRVGQLVQTALGSLPGPLGLFGHAVGSVTGVASQLGEAFREARASVGELSANLAGHQGLVRSSRQTGAPGAEDLREAFRGNALLHQLQRPGINPEQQAALLREYRGRAQQSLQAFEGRDRGRGHDDMLQRLIEARDNARRGNGAPAANAFEDLFQRHNVNRAELPAEFEHVFQGQTLRAMTDQQLRQIAATTMTGRLTQAQSQVQVADTLLRGGLMPNLRPGAAQLSDLPNLFQSRQGDVLDIHAQVQQEAVRDQRQEAQFQAQMRLWSEIQQDLRRLRFPAVN